MFTPLNTTLGDPSFFSPNVFCLYISIRILQVKGEKIEAQVKHCLMLMLVLEIESSGGS